MASNDLVWIKQQALMNSSGEDQNPSVAVDSAGNSYVAYRTTGTVSGGALLGSGDIVVFKIATDGTVLWIKQQSSTNTTSNERNPTVAVDSSGNVYVSYLTLGTVSGGTNTGTNDIAVFKMDTNGTVLWIQQQAIMNTTQPENEPSVAVDSTGNVYISYYTNGGTVSGGTNVGTYDIVVFKMSTNGSVVWVKQQAVMNSSSSDLFQSVAVDSAGNIYVAYYTSGTVSGGTKLTSADIVVFKMDSNGSVVWIKQQSPMNSNGIDDMPSIAVDYTGSVYVSYQTSGTVSGGTLGGTKDIVVFKMDSNGTVSWIKQQRIMNTTLADTNPRIAVDSTGSVYISYFTVGTVSGGTFLGSTGDIVVFKMDTNGTVDWIKQQTSMNSTLADINPSIAVDSAGNIYVSYSTTGTVSGGTNRGLNDIVIMKFASNLTAPSAPINVLAVDSGDYTATVSWTPGVPSADAAPTTSYTVTSDPPGFTATVSGSSTSAVVLGLTAGTYTFTVTATNAVGTSTLSSPSAALTVAYSAPSSAPTNVLAVDSGNALATVTWTAPTNTGNLTITSYTVVASPSNLTRTVSGTATSAVFVGLATGTSYTFTVQATNALGTSPVSSPSVSLLITSLGHMLTWIKQERVMSTNQDDTLPSVAVDSAGNSYVAYGATGTVSGGTLVGSSAIAVFKMDSNGSVVWIKQQSIMSNGGSPSVALDSAGNLYVSYQTSGTVSGGTKMGSNDIAVFKMDTNGNVLWVKQQSVMNSTANDTASKIGVDSAGNVYISYQTTGTVSGGTYLGGTFGDIVISKMDTNGSVQWVKQQNIMNTATTDATPSVAVDSDGNVYVAYAPQATVSGGTFAGVSDIAVLKMASNGTVQWIRQQSVMNTIAFDGTPSIAVDSAGSVYVSYRAQGTVSGGTYFAQGDIVVFKMDSNGSVQWIKQEPPINTPGWNELAPSLAVDSAGSVYVSYYVGTAVSGGVAKGGSDIILFKMDSNGSVSWIKQEPTMNSSGADINPSIAVDLNGNVYVSYQSSSTVSGGVRFGFDDIIVMKFAISGEITAPSVTNVLAVDSGQATATVSWTSGAPPGATLLVSSYTVTSEPPGFTATVSGSSTSVRIEGLAAGTSYTFTVTATTTQGSVVSDPSAPLLMTSVAHTLAWIRQTPLMNSAGSDTVPSVAVDSLGNSYVAYQTTGQVSGGTFLGGAGDIVVFKMDTTGTVNWIKQQAVMSTPLDDQFPRIAVGPSGSVYVTYYTTGTVSGGTNKGVGDIVVFKMDSNGSVQWINQQSLMNSTANDQEPSVAVDSVGNVYVSYYTAGQVSGGTFLGSFDVVVFKMDSNGSLSWIKQQAVMNTTAAEQPPSVAVDSLGFIYVSYYTNGTVSGGSLLGSYDIVVFKMDTDGTVIWIKEQSVMNSTALDLRPSVAVDSGGSVYVSYQTAGTVSGGTRLGGTNDIVIFKLDTNGTVQWIKQQTAMNSSDNDQRSSVAVDSAGSVYVSYQTAGTVSGGTFLGTNDIVLIKMATNGTIQWIKQQSIMNTTGNELTPIIAVDSPGNFYVSYQTTGTVSGGTFLGTNDIVVIKFATSAGTFTAPSAATNVLAVDSGEAAATVSWTPAATSGSTLLVSNYTVTSIPYGYTATVSSSATSAIVRGLAAGTSYTFTVRSNTSVGFVVSQPSSVPLLITSVAHTLAWIKQQRIMNTSAADEFPSVATDSAGNSYVAYMTTGTVSGGTNIGAASTNDIVVFKMDTNGTVLWVKQQSIMSTSSDDQRPKIAVDSAGSVYVSYQSQGTVSGGTNRGASTNDIVVFKMDTNGSVQWIKQQSLMNTTNSEYGPSIALDSLGNIYVTYMTDGTVSGGTFLGGYDIVVFKMDSNGTVQWIKQQRVMNSTSNDNNLSIAADQLGNVYVTYYTDGTVSGGTFLGGNDIVVFKMSTDGSVQWIKQQRVMNTIGSDANPKIAVDSAGSVYVSYMANGTVSGGTNISYDIVVFKMDTNGSVQWIKQQRAVNTNDYDQYPSVAVDSLGSVYVSYFTLGVGSGGAVLGSYDIILFKMDTNGSVQWVKQQAIMNTTMGDEYPSVAVDSVGNVYISYRTNGTVSGGTFLGSGDIVVMKFATSAVAVVTESTVLRPKASFIANNGLRISIQGNLLLSS